MKASWATGYIFEGLPPPPLDLATLFFAFAFLSMHDAHCSKLRPWYVHCPSTLLLWAPGTEQQHWPVQDRQKGRPSA